MNAREPATRLELRVAAIRDLTPAIRGFRLEPVGGETLPDFSAGAHIKVGVKLPDGGGDERCYSLVNSTDRAGYYELGVQRDPRSTGGSIYMHSLRVGDTLFVRGPQNDFPLDFSARHTLLIAGGIGITPILAMVRTLRKQGASFEMHYSARSPELMAFRSEAEETAGKHLHLYFDGGDPARGPDLAALLATPDVGRHVYVCGPKGLIDATLGTAKRFGWAPQTVHFELFGNATPRGGDREIEIELRRSRKVLNVRANQSILDAMIEAQLDPMFDCRRGECGSCAIEVLEGVPDHRDYNLTDEERASGSVICTCVSRAKTARLVLNA